MFTSHEKIEVVKGMAFRSQRRCFGAGVISVKRAVFAKNGVGGVGNQNVHTR